MASRRVCDFGAVMASDLGDVVDGSGHSRHALVVLRARLPAVGQLLAAHAQLVRTQAQQLLALAVEDALVRAEELVAGAGQEVGIERLHVDESVRRVVHGVDEGHRADVVRQANGLLNVVDRAHGIRGPSHGHQARAAANLGLQIEHVEACSRRA